MNGPISAPLSVVPPANPADLTVRDEKLRRVAEDLESAFLAEMLRHAGAGTARETMGGGIGEEQMSSFLTDLHAQEIARNGGLGLAETIFRSLAERADG